MNVSVKNVLLDGKKTNVYIEDGRIAEIGGFVEADRVIDGSGKAVIPGLVNAHTHAAMTLMRGYADDLPLQEWLENKIWPMESRLNEELVYWGTRLACIEMIRSGTVAFNDMYHFQEGALRAVSDSGIKAVMGPVLIDLHDPAMLERGIRVQKRFFSTLRSFSNPRIRGCVNPHAVYSLSREGLEWCRDYAEENGFLLHIHLSETKRENDEFFRKEGKSPAEYLDGIGILTERTIAAHCVWLSHKDIDILSKRGVSVAHCPASNMKLSTGRAMPYGLMSRFGVNIALGTDGCASNNNLDMFEEMKIAALLHKHASGEASIRAADAFRMATENGAKALGTGTGRIEEGAPADMVLVSVRRPEMTPLHDLVSNLVYSASGSCVDTVIVDGRILMEKGVVDGETEVLKKASEAAEKLAENSL